MAMRLSRNMVACLIGELPHGPCLHIARARYDDFGAKKDQLFRCGNYDKAALVIRAEYHGPGAGRGRPKPLLELPGRFYNSTSAWDLYYQPDVRRVGYTGRGTAQNQVFFMVLPRYASICLAQWKCKAHGLK